MTTPILWFHFNTITPITLLSNALLMYPIEWTVLYSASLSLISFLPDSIVSECFKLLEIGIDKILLIINWLADNSKIISLTRPNINIIIITYIRLLTKNKLTKILCAIEIVCILVTSSHIKQKELIITFIDVNQGDAILI